MNGRVESVNISRVRGTIKTAVEEITLTDTGIQGDAHGGHWHRQVSLLSQEDVERFALILGRPLEPGEFAENLTISGLDFTRLGILDRLRIGGTEVEITQIGKVCHGSGCAIYQQVGDCIMPRLGLFARTIKPGKIKAGDPVQYLPHELKIHVVTLSDRASAGEYEDLSGPRVRARLEEFLGETRWHPVFSRDLIPDDPEQLDQVLRSRIEDRTDLIFTTGGTGVGPRDITPEVVTALADKMIPGIMDHIRLKYGQKIPSALLSRSVAAVAGQTLIFTLPGSVKAVNEYLDEIAPLLDHLIRMLHSIGH